MVVSMSFTAVIVMCHAPRRDTRGGSVCLRCCLRCACGRTRALIRATWVWDGAETTGQSANAGALRWVAAVVVVGRTRGRIGGRERRGGGERQSGATTWARALRGCERCRAGMTRMRPMTATVSPRWRDGLQAGLTRLRLVGNLKDRPSSPPRWQDATRSGGDTDVPRCLDPVLGLRRCAGQKFLGGCAAVGGGKEDGRRDLGHLRRRDIADGQIQNP